MGGERLCVPWDLDCGSTLSSLLNNLDIRPNKSARRWPFREAIFQANTKGALNHGHDTSKTLCEFFCDKRACVMAKHASASPQPSIWLAVARRAFEISDVI